MPPGAGTLYLVATPIGNLEDITLRALRLLREVDLVAAEDTRRTRKLLSAYQIHRPLLSYHEHNIRTQGPRILRTLLAGKSVALVTDAGTPGISDPGTELVRHAAARNIPVTTAPGPCAVTAALTLAGLSSQCFVFLGYPPNKTAARCRFFASYARVEQTLVLFESPRRLGGCLRDMRKIWGDRQLAVAREMTKAHEEIFRGSLEEALKRWPTAARGEVTLVVAGAAARETSELNSLAAHLGKLLLSDRRPLKEIAAEVAEQRGLSRRLVYQEALKLRRRESNL